METENERSFDSVSMNSLTFHSVKSAIFTRLESSSNQKRSKIAHKVDTGSNENLMTFRIFRTLFRKSIMVELNATIDKSVVLKTYNQSNKEQLGRCLIKIRHNDRCVKCRFFLVPGDDPALISMPDMEFLGIITVICKSNKDSQTKPDASSVSANKSSTPNCLNS